MGRRRCRGACARAMAKHETNGGRDWTIVQARGFNPSAKPNLPFFTVLRACLGRRLASLEMRVALTLLIWSFEFVDMGENLSNFGVIDRATEVPKNCYIEFESYITEQAKIHPTGSVCHRAALATDDRSPPKYHFSSRDALQMTWWSSTLSCRPPSSLCRKTR